MSGQPDPANLLPANLLEVRGLRVHFHTRDGVVRAVDGVDFTVGRAETLCLVGESGSGKTVTSLALLRLVPPPARIEGGSVRFEGAELLDLPPRAISQVRGRRMAMVFQNPASSLNPLYTVGAQLGEVLRTHEGLTRAQALDRVVALLAEVGLGDPGARLRQYPHELSGGQKQRVGIARALLCNPALVLADEPTTALDVTIQAQILDLLTALRERHQMSMILVTHDMGVVARMADRITVMYAGRVCETGSAATLFRDPLHPYTRALLESTPRIDQSYGRSGCRTLATIPGRPPDLLNPPSGCRFRTRCPEAIADCARLLPEETLAAPGHTVSCIRRGSQALAA